MTTNCTMTRSLQLLADRLRHLVAEQGMIRANHAFLLARILSRMLARIDALDTDIAAVETRIEDLIVPFAEAVVRLDVIPGVGATATQMIMAQIDMHRFPTAAHLASWARLSPIISESAGKRGTNATGKGNPPPGRWPG